MAYTAPRTWVTGELVTAALMQAQVSDNMTVVKTPITDAGLIHVLRNNATTDAESEIENIGAGDAGLMFSIVGDSYIVGIDNTDDSFQIAWANGAGTAVFGGSATRFQILPSGDIGVGNTSGVFSPTCLLHVIAEDSDTRPAFEIENAGVGDAAIQFTVSDGPGSSWAMGIDNDDTDTFKIAWSTTEHGAVLGTGDYFEISITGAVLINKGLTITEAFITPVGPELTIAAGVVTATHAIHEVDTQDNDAADDLVTINGGVDGMRLILIADNNGRDVTLKDGTGNLELAGDFVLGTKRDTIELVYRGETAVWLELRRSTND